MIYKIGIKIIHISQNCSSIKRSSTLLEGYIWSEKNHQQCVPHIQKELLPLFMKVTECLIVMALQRLTPAMQQSVLRSHSRMEVRGHRQPPLDTTHSLVSLKHTFSHYLLLLPWCPPWREPHTFSGWAFRCLVLKSLSLYIIDRVQQRNTSPTFNLSHFPLLSSLLITLLAVPRPGPLYPVSLVL